MKKLVVMLLALTMVLSMAVSLPVMAAKGSNSAFSDIEGTDYEKEVTVLSSLGLVAGYDDGTFKGEKTVTRAEMAAFIVRELGLEDAAISGVASKFYDVPASHWASGSIVVATTKGFIVGMGDGTFCPDQNVTYQQAVTMLVSALGYTLPATRLGGWPSGYLIQGAKIGLTDGIEAEGTSNCNRGIVAKLLYNALEVNLMEEVAYSGNAVQYEETDKTLLYNNLDIVKLYDAEIKATATNGAAKTNKGEAKVSGVYDKNGTVGYQESSLTVLVGDTDPDAYFGDAVIMYYKDNGRNKKPTLLCIIDDGDSQETCEIAVANLYSSKFLCFPGESNSAGANNGKYVRLYYKADTDVKAKYVNLLNSDLYSENCTITINGAVKDNADWSELESIKNGTIKLVDAKTYDVSEGRNYNGGDGIFEKAIVSTYNNYVVSEVDYEDKVITATNDVEFTLDEDEKTFSIYDTEGNILTVDDLKENDVLSVYADEIDPLRVDDAESMKIIVSNETVTGSVTEITSKYVFIDGEKYKPSGDMNIDMFDLDDEGTFYLNPDGEIVYADTESATANYAVFYDVYKDSSRRIVFDAITSTGKQVEFTANSNIDVVEYGTVSGVYSKKAVNEFDFSVSGDVDNAIALLGTKETSVYKPYIASYTLKKGSDSQLDTIYLAGSPSGATSYKSRFAVWADGISAYYNSAEGTLGSFDIDGSTVIFDIPVTVKSASDSSKIKVYGKSGLKSAKTYDNVSVYDADKYNTAKAVLIKSTASDADVANSLAIIQRVTTAKNAEGDTTYKLYMLENGKLTSKVVEKASVLENYGKATTANGYTQYSLDIGYGFYPGSAIIYSENGSGEIESLIKIYPTVSVTGEATDETPYYKGEFFTTWNNSDAKQYYNEGCDMFIVYGVVTDKNVSNKNITVRTKYKETKGSQAEDLTVTANYSSANITVVDYMFDDDEEKVSIGSASDIKEGSYVLIRKKDGATRDIVVYKDSFKPDEYIY